MSSLGASESQNEAKIVLPYKLKRPQFVFFRSLSLILIPVLTVLFLTQNEVAFSLVALMGGSLWLVMGFILLVNWQVVTLCDEHLLIVNYGQSQQVPYIEIRALETTPGARGTDGPTALPTVHVHRASKEKTLKINLANLAVKDRTVLIQALQARAPEARLDALSQQLATGEWTG